MVNRKSSIKILSFAALLYLAYCTYFYLLQREMLFPINYVNVPLNISDRVPDSSKLWIDNDFGKTEAWYFLPKNFNSDNKYPLMIVAHGNADVIDKWVNIISYLRENGIAILLVEYPGYGRSEGNPTQESITEVFIKCYDKIIERPEIDRDRIIFLGQSIGGGAICALAKERKSAAMILISAFTSVSYFASQYFLPSFLVKDEFDNLMTVSNYKNPLLLVHGSNDNLIPISEAEKLRSVSKNAELIILDGGHNTIKDWKKFWRDTVVPFLHKNQIL